MPRDVADPIALTPDTRSDGDFRIQLHAHLEIALKNRLRNGERARGGGIALEAANHGLVIALFGRFGRRDGRGTVDGFVQDRVIGVVLLHGAKVVWAFKKVLTLAGGVLCADGLAVDALRGETLC